MAMSTISPRKVAANRENVRKSPDEPRHATLPAPGASDDGQKLPSATPMAGDGRQHGETLGSEHSRAPKVADEGDIRPPGTGTSDISQKKVVQRPERLSSKTMTPAALAANRANAQKSTGPVTPEGKKKVTLNALQDGFFAQQDDNIIGMDLVSRAVYEDILSGLMTMYSPINFLDEVRIRRLAALLFKRSQLLDRAEAGETTRSVLRYRRATRFAEPPTPPDELLEKDPAVLQRRSDGVEYLGDVLEALIGRMAEMETDDEVVTAGQAAAARLKSALPSFHSDVTGLLERSAVLAVIRRHVLILEAEATRLANEERALGAAEEARRVVPKSKHYERIMRAMRETTREINHLEWCLAPLRSPFGAKAR